MVEPTKVMLTRMADTPDFLWSSRTHSKLRPPGLERWLIPSTKEILQKHTLNHWVTAAQTSASEHNLCRINYFLGTQTHDVTWQHTFTVNKTAQNPWPLLHWHILLVQHCNVVIQPDEKAANWLYTVYSMCCCSGFALNSSKRRNNLQHWRAKAPDCILGVLLHQS